MTDKTKQALEHFTKLQKSLEKKLSKFQDEFQKDPQRALSWADGTFADVSMLEQVKRVVYSLTIDAKGYAMSVRETEGYLMESLINHNICLSHSTSQSSNILAFYKGQSITEVLRQLGHFK